MSLRQMPKFSENWANEVAEITFWPTHGFRKTKIAAGVYTLYTI
jgi:hypothetical protein